VGSVKGFALFFVHVSLLLSNPHGNAPIAGPVTVFTVTGPVFS
jgi:hypothetical protein